MANPTCQENRPLQEWAPLTNLLEKIPATILSGLFTQNVNFTCIDIVAEFVAIGTNHGIVYWFNRKTEEIETLGCQNSNSSITCIRIVSTVDYMVAAGNDQGVVTIFQIPKQLPDSLPETWKYAKKKQVERYIISGLHKVSITAVEWSKNGMKLFSGDQSGLVVLTEMDFYMHLSKSTEFLNEKYRVVQLSYQNGLLLISTLFRAIIIDGNDCNRMKQVGQKERRVLGKFGAVFFKNKNHIEGPIIYTSRPGLRIWQADKNGIVLKTLILKEAAKADENQVKLLNPVSDNSKKKIDGNTNFGIVMPFSDDLLLTYNHDVIYIVNPNTSAITSVVSNLRKVSDVACFKDEIFVLEGERNILRIAYCPEAIINSGKGQPLDCSRLVPESNSSAGSGLVGLRTKMKLNSTIPAFLYDKIKPTNIIQAMSIRPSVVIGIDTTSIINADEAIEVPASIPINLDSKLVTAIDDLKSSNQTEKYILDRKHVFQKIGEQEFEEIVFNPQKKDNQETREISDKLQMKVLITDKSGMQINFQENKLNNALAESKNTFHQVCNIDRESSLEYKNNLERIQKSILDKEKLLFNYLNLDLSTCMNQTEIGNKKSNPSDSTDFSECANGLTHSYAVDRNCDSLVS